MMKLTTLVTACLCFLLGLGYLNPTQAATFTVSNLNDAGVGSFRAALFSANGAAGADVIQFNVIGSINLLSALPAVTDVVTIDGTTAPGYVVCGPPMVELNGSAAAGNGLRLLAGSAGSVIRAIVIRNFPLNGIILVGSVGTTITRCFIGTNQAGTLPAPNGSNGLQIENGSNLVLVGGPVACDGNLISGNNGAGVSVNNSDGVTISGNLIGTSVTGATPLGNAQRGVFITNGSDNALVGGSTVPERNIISGNGTGLTGNGIDMYFGTGGAIRGNYIGLDITGTVPMGNAENGIVLNGAPNSVVGGTGANEGNIITDHNFHAVLMVNGANNCGFYGNICGTNTAGDLGLSNTDSGIIVITSSDISIGGPTPAHRNVLSGSIEEWGILIEQCQRTIVQGNYIGTDPTGTSPIPNFQGGIRIANNSDLTEVGGSGAGEANLIAHNTGYGVGIFNATCTQNLISRNSIYCNTGKGIDLNGVANLNWPAPVITNFDASGASGTASPNDIIELFYDESCTPPCQGKTYITTVTANGAGNWSYVGPLSVANSLAATATSTGASVNNTSEFICRTPPLPVEYDYFQADLHGEQVELAWRTALEINNDRFVIQKSTDAVHFTTLGIVRANEQTQQNSDYVFYDIQPVEGFNYYRLEQFDVNGTSSFSEVRSVYINSNQDGWIVGPNPTMDRLIIRSVPGNSIPPNMTIVNVLGQKMSGLNQVIEAGNGEWIIDTSKLKTGVYILLFHDPSNIERQRIVFQRN